MRFLSFSLGLILLAATPALADSEGSATGGNAAPRSTAAGCVNQTVTLGSGQQATLKCDASGNLVVSGTVSGTVTANQGAAGSQAWPVNTPVPSDFATNQQKVAVTGTALKFQTASAPLVNGVQYCALTTNTGKITVGGPTLGSSLTNVTDGTGNGEVLAPGQCNSKAISNINLMWMNGTAPDGISFGGN